MKNTDVIDRLIADLSQKEATVTLHNWRSARERLPKLYEELPEDERNGWALDMWDAVLAALEAVRALGEPHRA